MTASNVQVQDLEEALRSIERQFEGQPQRLRFIMGGIRELSRVAANLSEEQLRQLPRGNKFAHVLVERLSDLLPAAPDPLARAKTRGVLARREMLWDVDEPPIGVGRVAELLHISRQAVDKRRRERKLLAVTNGGRRYLYPGWQFTETGVLSGLTETLRALEGQPPWACLRFFVSGNHRLGGRRPLDLLREGWVQNVVEAAKAFGEQGAA